jgi:integrase
MTRRENMSRINDYLEFLKAHGPRKIKSLARRAGVDASTHTLRRLFGTMIYSATDHDLAATARLLRHADIATTVECYIEPSRNRDTQTLDTLCDMLTF